MDKHITAKAPPPFLARKPNFYTNTLLIGSVWRDGGLQYNLILPSFHSFTSSGNDLVHIPFQSAKAASHSQSGMRGTHEAQPRRDGSNLTQLSPLDDWVKPSFPSHSPCCNLVLSYTSFHLQYLMANPSAPALFANTILVSRDAGQVPTLQTIGVISQPRKKRPHSKSRRGCVACKRRRVKVRHCGVPLNNAIDL